MITEHTDTTTTTPQGARQRYLGDQSRTRHHNPPDHHLLPSREEAAAQIIAAPVLKMLASTIQFSNNNPHTLHTGGRRPPERGHDHRQDAGNLRHNTPTPTKEDGACCLRTQ